MSKKTLTNDVIAKNFIISAKNEFKKFIPRDTIDEISATECIEKDGAFDIIGSVGTISPTGKQKTFKYSAVVKVDEKGTCALSGLQIDDL